MSKQQKIALIIGHVWPESKSTAAGQNLMSYIKALKSANWQIHFATAAETSHLSDDLSSLDIITTTIQINDDNFNNLVTKLTPTVVIFDRFMTEEQFGWRVTENCPDAMRILNCEDLHGLREGRHQFFKHQLGNVYQSSDLITDVNNADFLNNAKLQRELASIYRCDLSITLSAFEFELLVKRMGVMPDALLHLPFIRQNKVISNASFDSRKDIICIGNMLHMPNVIANEKAINVIFPEVHKALPDINLHIYGNYAPHRISQLHNPKKGVFIHGFVEDHLNVIASAKLLLAPIDFGAGIKGKLIDAMTTATPSVTSEIGAEGICEFSNWPGFICKDDNDFISCALQLLTDKDTWQTASKKSQEALISSGVNTSNADKLMLRIDKMLGNLKSIRANNYQQSVLMQQHLLASRYLSKWIQFKNQTLITRSDSE